MKNILRFLFRKKLTYGERIRWFINNYYETGMEYEVLLCSMENEDLDNIKHYNDIIKIPKYKYIDEIRFFVIKFKYDENINAN
jgi:hypothetical protein